MVMLVWCHPSRSTSRALQRWWGLTVEAPRSRLLKWLMWAGLEALAEEGWTPESNSRWPCFLHSFPSLWNRPSSHGLSASCPSFQAHHKHTLPWNHPELIFLPAGFCLHLSFLVKDPSYSVPSFVHVHTPSHSSWGVRSVHQALFWNLMLIISNPHSKLHSQCWPHFTDEETEKLRPHHWSESSELLNRRAGIWTSSYQFRAFCSFTSCCPVGDWRYVWNEDNT